MTLSESAYIAPASRLRLLLARLILAAALALACPPPAAPGTGSQPLVHSFRIRGNHILGTSLIQAELLSPRPSLLPWKKPPVFQPDELENDVNRVLALYRRQGFYHAKAATQVTPLPGGEEVDILLTIDEGPWIKVERLTLTLVDPEQSLNLEPFLREGPLRLGDRFSEPMYEDVKKNVLNYLLDHGYPRAQAEGEVLVDDKQNLAYVTIQVWPGTLSRFGPVSITGAQKTPIALIRRQLAFTPGQTFSLSKLSRSQERIYDLDLFSSVTLTPAEVPPEQPEVPITVTVQEKQARSLKLGAGYGSEDQFRARAILRYRNLGGGGRIAEVNTKYSRLETRLEGSFLNPQLASTENDLVASAGYIRRYLPGFTDKALFARAVLERQLWQDLKGYLGYGLEFARPFNIPTETLVLLNETEPGKIYRASMLVGGFSYTGVDNPVDPQSGSLMNVQGEYAPAGLGSTLQFLRFIPEIRHYQGLGIKNVLLASRLKFGAIEPIQATAQIPIYRRFFSGGSGSVRGYRLDYLGPRNVSGDPIGGNAVLEGNLELRFPLYKNFRAAAFLDFGNVFLQVRDVNLGQLKYGAGCGLRYQTPIGPIGVDVAPPLNPIDPSRDKYQIYFTIGQPF